MTPISPEMEVAGVKALLACPDGTGNINKVTRIYLAMTSARPSTDVERVVAKLTYNERPRWWASLTDHVRKMLKRDSTAMMEAAFEAGCRAALDTDRAEASNQSQLRDALFECASGLAVFINAMGERRKDGSHRVGLIVSRDSAQRMMAANNQAAELLAKIDAVTGGGG